MHICGAVLIIRKISRTRGKTERKREWAERQILFQVLVPVVVVLLV